MKSRIVIVALNIDCNDDFFTAFSQKTVEEKIAYFEMVINSICEQLRELHPDSLWIITWREYGVTGSIYRHITDEDKKCLIGCLTKLVSEFPQLVILTGGVAVLKPYTEDMLDKINNTEDCYHNLKLSAKKDVVQQELHTKQLKIVKNNVENAKTKAIYIMENLSIICGRGVFETHKKSTPFYETVFSPKWWDKSEKRSFMHNTIYKPASRKKPSSCAFELSDLNGEKFKVLAEGCREHHNGVAIEEAKQTNEPYLIHFVFSFQMRAYINHIAAEYFLLLDNEVKPQLIVSKFKTKTELENLPVKLYEVDILRSPKLKGPLQPISPKEFEALTLFNELEQLITTSTLPEKNDLLKAFYFFYQAFCDALKLNVPGYKLANKIFIDPQFEPLGKLKEIDEVTSSICQKVSNLFAFLGNCNSILNPLNKVEVETQINDTNNNNNNIKTGKHF